MNGVAILKLDESLWVDIQKGKKYTEIRKLNKDYIQTNYTIVYIGLNTNKLLGEVWCIGKLYKTPQLIIKEEKHIPTKEFVKERYMKEPLLIQFTITIR